MESLAQSHRLLFLWLLRWLPSQNDALMWCVLAFQWRLCWWLWIAQLPCFLGFRWLLGIFHVKAECLISKLCAKPPVWRTWGFLYQRVRLEEMLHRFTVACKSGRQKSMPALRQSFVLVHKRARQLFLFHEGFIWARNLLRNSTYCCISCAQTAPAHQCTFCALPFTCCRGSGCNVAVRWGGLCCGM